LHWPFLDLKKTFDVCSNEILLKKFKKYGINGKAHDWFRSYLTNRKQCVDINGSFSSTKIFNISVIQGSILGSILFLIYINDLYNASSLLKFMFADDTACVASNTNLDNLITYVNEELKKVARWFRANKMAVNVSKTKFILFHTKGKIVNPNIKLIYDDNEPHGNDPTLIHPVECFHLKHPNPQCRAYKILGVYIDEMLSFDHHTQHIVSKLNRSLYCINRVKNFLPAEAMRTLYFALLHSHLSYCPIITSCGSNANIQKIIRVQKKAICIISNKHYLEHTAPLFESLNIVPCPKLVIYSKLNFMHSVIYNYCPKSYVNIWKHNNERSEIHNRSLRNSDELEITHPRLELYKKSPIYSLPKLWNELDDTRFQHCRTTFSISIEDKLLKEPNFLQ
jgi:hypothetical protein